MQTPLHPTISGSPLVLANYLVTEYRLDATSSELATPDRTMSIEIDASNFLDTGEKAQGIIALDIFVGGEEFTDANECPCHFRIEGRFLASAETSDETLAMQAFSAGAQELYGIAKGILATLSAGLLGGRILLPSIQLGSE